jgi:hypothetical protein
VKEGAARHRRGAGPRARNSGISQYMQPGTRQYVGKERALVVDLSVDGTISIEIHI